MVSEGANVTIFRLFARCEFCDEGHPLPFAVSLEISSDASIEEEEYQSPQYRINHIEPG
jgi:hypothetical protein